MSELPTNIREKFLVIFRNNWESPWIDFGPKQRQELLEQAQRLGVDAALIWRPLGADTSEWLPSSEWPKPGKRVPRFPREERMKARRRDAGT